MTRSVRHCSGCATTIDECMGFVKAGDVLAGVDPPRELCGRCVNNYGWNTEGQLVRIEPYPNLPKLRS